MLKYLILFIILCCFSVQSVEAQPYNADSLVRVINSGESTALIMHAKVLLGSMLIPSHMDSAFALIQQSAKLSESDNPHHRADYLNTLGVYYWYSGEFESAIEQFIKITKLKEAPDMYMKLARAYNNAGALLGRLRHFDSAHVSLNEALRIDQLRNNEPGIAKTYYDLSTLHYRLGRFELSLKYQLASVKINESRNDSMRLIYGYNVLGNLYYKLDDFTNSEASYLKALKLSEALPQYRQKSIILNNLSALYCNIPEKFDVALAHANEGLKAAESEDKQELKGFLLVNIGGAYDAVRNYKEALRYYHLGRELLQKEKTPSELDRLYLSLANLHLSLNNPDSTYYYANKARALTGASGSPESHSKALMSLSSADSIRGDFFSALANYQQAIALRDSVWGNENTSRIAELRIIHETDKKASENLLLTEQNVLKSQVIRKQRYFIFAISILVVLIVVLLVREHKTKQKILVQKKEIDKKNEALTELNKTKDKFFRIIAHDLKGPISALASLLEHTDSEFENMDDVEKAKIIHILKQSSTNTYNLLENLLEWSQANTGKIVNKPEKFDLYSVVNQVFGFLESRAKQKNQLFCNEVPEFTFVVADRQLVSNVLVNLINNAIKFSIEHSTIRVTASGDDVKKAVSVIDQGIGITQDAIDKLFRIDSVYKRPGTNNEPGTGLGLIMVAEYLQIIGSEIKAESQPGQGTTFTFTLPGGQETYNFTQPLPA